MMITSENELLFFDPNPSEPLPEKFLQKAKRELNETTENKRLFIQQLRELIEGEKNLTCRTCDEYLTMFLRARKYNVHRAFSLLKRSCQFKRKNPEIFTGFDYDVLVRLTTEKILWFLPYRDADGCAIIVCHVDNWHPSNLDISHVIRAIALYFFQSIEDPLNQINGYKVILDVNSTPLRHLRHATPSNLYLLYTGTLRCFPGKFKAIHIVNMSLVFKVAFTIINPFLPEKIKNRIVFHKDNESLLEHFSESILPADFGGVLKDADTSSFLRYALEEDNLKKSTSGSL